jgi:hypothetical protein
MSAFPGSSPWGAHASTTSVTTGAWPIFDVAEMAEEASERAGIEFRSGYSLRTARRALELLSIEWANRGLNLWTVEGPTTVVLTPGTAQYSLPDDTIDLVEHVVRDPGPPQDVDQPLERFTFSEYATLPNKLAPGRPSLISIRREIHPYFLIWMVPPPATDYQIVYWRLRRLGTFGAGGTGQPDIPWRFIPAMIAGLAFYLALKSKDPKALEKIQLLKSEYLEQFELASDEDRDRASFYFVPGGYDF